MNELIVRLVQQNDFAELGEVDAAARHHAYAGLVPAEELAAATPEKCGAAWAHKMEQQRNTHQLFVAERDGRIVGYSYGGPGVDPELGDLYAIFVHPEAHGTGVAQQLLAQSESALEGMGYRRFLLYVHEENRQAVRFYEKHGWAQDGTSPEDPKFLRYLKLSRATVGEGLGD